MVFFRAGIISSDNGGYDWSLLIQNDKFAIFGGSGVLDSVAVQYGQWQQVTSCI